MGYLADSFRKVTLTTVLATTLFAGVGQSAFAQGAQAGPPPQPDGTTQTEQVRIPVKAWENDPNYVRLMNAYDHTLQARLKLDRGQANGQLEIMEGNFQIQQANLEQNRVAMMRNPAGWGQYAAQQAQIQGAYESGVIRTKGNLQSQEAREDITRMQYIQNLDNRFAQLPQYKNGAVARPDQGAPPWATDQSYIQQMRLFDQQQAAQRQIADANENATLRSLEANHASQMMSANSQGINAIRQGLPGVARLGAQDKIFNAQYQMQRISTEATYEMQAGQRETARAEFIFNLDRQFSAMPQYKNAVAPQPGVKAPAPAPAPRPGA